jgi:hypothetical protein
MDKGCRARDMRKKPDILLLLMIMVVSGVVISDFVIFKNNNKNTNFSLLNEYKSKKLPHSTIKNKPDNRFENKQEKNFSVSDVAHIDLSKQQTH